MQLPQIMGGACHKNAALPRYATCSSWHQPRTQMHAGTQRRGQPRIPGNHQGQPAVAADPRQIPAKPRPVRRAVVA